MAVLRGDALIVPFGDPQRILAAFVDVNTRAVSLLALPRGSLLAPAAFRVSDGRTGIAAYDAGLGAGATGLRIYLVTDQLHWTDVALQAPFPQGANRQIGIGLQAAATANGTIHLCATTGSSARRYVIGTDLKGTSVGTDCGPLSGGDRILMGSRDPAQLQVLDEKTGKALRTLPLAGVPARLVQ